MGVPLSAPGYGLLRMLKVFASTNSTGTPSGSIYLAFQLVYSNFFPKYSMTRKEKVKHKNSLYRFYSKEPLALTIEKRVYVKGLFTHDSLHRSELKTLDGGNPKTQNHHQSVVDSCSLICYVPDQFIVQSTKSLYLAPRILKERTQWEGCGVEDYLRKHRTKNYASSKKGWIGTFTKLYR